MIQETILIVNIYENFPPLLGERRVLPVLIHPGADVFIKVAVAAELGAVRPVDVHRAA